MLTWIFEFVNVPFVFSYISYLNDVMTFGKGWESTEYLIMFADIVSFVLFLVTNSDDRIAVIRFVRFHIDVQKLFLKKNTCYGNKF